MVRQEFVRPDHGYMYVFLLLYGGTTSCRGIVYIFVFFCQHWLHSVCNFCDVIRLG